MGKRDNVQLAVKTTAKIRERIVYPVLTQPKLNGVRCYAYIDDFEGELFHEPEVMLMSSENNRYRIPHIEAALLETLKANPYLVLDGELYIHDTPLNQIIRRLPKTNANGTVSKASLPTEDLSFRVFDLVDDDEQQSRIARLRSLFYDKVISSTHISEVPTKVANTVAELEMQMEIYEEQGYEGLIIRYPESLYTKGSKRVKVMLKWKKSFDTECKILDIKSEGIKNGVYILKLTLVNDINDELFVAGMGDDDRHKGAWSNAHKKELYEMRDKYIGQYATVKAYERSGVKKVPFHANVVALRNYE